MEAYVLIGFYSVYLVFGTVDVNETEWKLLSQRLTAHQCRQLVALLYHPEFDAPKSVDEGNINHDADCLALLMEWSNTRGEGLGQTHVLISRRLRQMGLSVLADWLSRTVSEELDNDLDNVSETRREGTSEEVKNFLTTTESIMYQTQVGDSKRTSIVTIVGVCVLLVFLLAGAQILFKAGDRWRQKDEEEIPLSLYRPVVKE